MGLELMIMGSMDQELKLQHLLNAMGVIRPDLDSSGAFVDPLRGPLGRLIRPLDHRLPYLVAGSALAWFSAAGSMEILEKPPSISLVQARLDATVLLYWGAAPSISLGLGSLSRAPIF